MSPVSPHPRVEQPQDWRQTAQATPLPWSPYVPGERLPGPSTPSQTHDPQNPWGIPRSVDPTTPMRDITRRYSLQRLYDFFSGGLEGAGEGYMSKVTGVNRPEWYSSDMTLEELLRAGDKFAPEGMTGKEYIASWFHSEDPDKTWYDDWLDRGDYEGMDEDAMRARAQEFADIYSSPQMEALSRQLEQSIADAEAATGRIGGAYGHQFDRLSEAEQQKAKRDLEASVARGAGRSGVVDYKDIERGKQYAMEHGALSGAKAAEEAAIANQLQMIQRQVPEHQRQIQEQASRLQAQELQRLQELDYNRRIAHEQEQFMRALQVVDFTQLSAQERAFLVAEYARIFGEMPSGFPDPHGDWGNVWDREEEEEPKKTSPGTPTSTPGSGYDPAHGPYHNR